jgi:uncharacterized Zn finger protein
MSRGDKTWWPPTSKPRRVEGGIKAQSQRGAFGERWWAKRWVDVLEGFGLGPRLSRGRSYARAGQVTGIVIEAGGVRAKVQGSRKAPYTVTIEVTPLTATEWQTVGDIVSKTPRLAAMLLNAEMPEDIESAFNAANCGLFPRSVADVRTFCSCPDWSNPCKHVAAVYYLIGEEFDRDPFLLFTLRGLERKAIASLISGPEPPRKRAAPSARTASRATSLETFWNGNDSNDPPVAVTPVEPPRIDAWLLRSAGRFPFWQGSITLEESLHVVYAKAGEDAAALLAETHLDKPGDA